MEKNTGKGYEIFVKNLMQAIINSDEIGVQKNIKVEHNIKLKDRCGIARQFDIYWEYDIAGINYKTIIECKDYNSDISISKVDELKGKLDDFPNIKGIIATKKGYQSGAEQKAKHNNIDLLKIKEVEETDFKDKMGNPLIRSISVNLTFRTPPIIKSFIPMLDESWLKNNAPIDNPILKNPITLSLIETYIDDLKENVKYFLKDIIDELPNEYKDDNEIKIEKEFENAFIVVNGKEKLKLHKYQLIYAIAKPIESKIHIDAMNELVGIVEYLNKDKRIMVKKDGSIREMDC